MMLKAPAADLVWRQVAVGRTPCLAGWMSARSGERWQSRGKVGVAAGHELAAGRGTAGCAGPVPALGAIPPGSGRGGVG